ncbi:Retrotransposon gag domain [Plasmopara halstedii]|uniref:Retrotransposon gag domain n=1 Tax=Plasmopara halstedii TaxID=4781 RepID=A0A0P1AT15_PLAHL|nr:Retrotransposon gag domain [Plasmopara halstedii]CEG45142.1 Retrotransposon gag domain [Plasmopara halstedii]|eukprot:XP_024581511.1 Retrotransposon gag domain [Plasmopara halstedii]
MAMASAMLQNEQQRAALAISKLGGRAREWALTCGASVEAPFPTWKQLKRQLLRMFSPPNQVYCVTTRFLAARQGKKEYVDFVQELRTLIAEMAADVTKCRGGGAKRSLKINHAELCDQCQQQQIKNRNQQISQTSLFQQAACTGRPRRQLRRPQKFTERHIHSYHDISSCNHVPLAYPNDRHVFLDCCTGLGMGKHDLTIAGANVLKSSGSRKCESWSFYSGGLAHLATNSRLVDLPHNQRHDLV